MVDCSWWEGKGGFSSYSMTEVGKGGREKRVELDLGKWGNVGLNKMCSLPIISQILMKILIYSLFIVTATCFIHINHLLFRTIL